MEERAKRRSTTYWGSFRPLNPTDMEESERWPTEQALYADASATSQTRVSQTAAVEAGSAMAGERLSLWAKLLYGAPNLAFGATAIPILINMPKFYADVVAVPRAYLAIAIASTRCLDAIIDPSIGLYQLASLRRAATASCRP